MKKCVSLGVISMVLGFTTVLNAQSMSGKVYKKDTQRKELLFTYSNSGVEDQGTVKVQLEFKDLAGQVVVHEEAERVGSQLKTYSVDHRQTGRKGQIVVEGQRVKFHFQEGSKIKDVEEEKLPPNFVVGPTLVPYVSEHWKEITAGHTVDIRFGVWDRQETVGFSLFKVGQEKLDGQEVVLLKFKPTSFVIAALVDPVIFKFSTDGKTLLGMVGRIMPKLKNGNKWKDLDAEVVYQKVN